MYQSHKTCRTRFTDEKLRNLRKNIEKFAWAKEKAEEILKKADYYLSLDPDHLATLVASHELMRSTNVNADYVCPICGKQRFKEGSADWIFDHKNHPWKVKCPSCGNLFPSNDFESFYKSGLDVHGQFSYDRADRTLLVNTLYPEKGPDFAVDDGHGWVRDPDDPEHSNFVFVGFYILQGLWTHRDDANNIMMIALKNLTMAYLITGDRKYGNPAAMLLNKVACVYPNMNALDCPWEKGYRLSHGLSGLGRVLGSIWDVLLMERLTDWYDMLFDCFDEELVAYLQEKPVRYIGEQPNSPIDIIANVEKLLLLIFPDYKARILNCNPGPPQALLLKSAVVLNRQDLFEECAEYIFKFIEPDSVSSRRMDLDSLMAGNVDRDGFADEVAIGYNAMWTSGFMEVAELLRGHKYDLFSHVKFRKMGSMVYQCVSADDFSLFIGDCWKTGDRYIRLEKDAQIKFFLETGDVKNAQLLVKVSGDGPICTDWFLDCEQIDKKIRQAAGGTFHSESRCVPSYGLAAIESHPEGKDPESLGIYFGSNRGHGHRDTMHMNLHGFGLDMMPDMGYPDHTGINAPRYRWQSNMLSHNTVTIRQEAPFPEEELYEELALHRSHLNRIDGGQIRHFHPGEKVSVIDTEAPELLDMPFRRTCVVVDTDGKSRYVVDLFEAGGKEQYISYHALGTEVTCEDVTFTPQAGGTYAGPDIPYADDDYSRRWCDGFNYLEDVRRCQAPQPGFTVDWQCVDNWHLWDRPRNVHLKLHMLSPVAEASLCKGMPPQTKPDNPRAMTYLIAKNTGSTARFATVLEPYEDSSFIKNAAYTELEDGKLRLICVEHKNGRVDRIAVNFTEQLRTVSWDGESFQADAFVTFRSFAPDGGLSLSKECGVQTVCGKVLDFTKGLQLENRVIAELPADVDAGAITGKYMDIETDTAHNACFRIEAAEQLADGTWALSTGDSSFVVGFLDRKNKDLGYRYCIRENAGFKISV